MSATNDSVPGKENVPLSNLDEWEKDVLQRYPDPSAINKDKKEEEFRNYEETVKDSVKEFYRLNHIRQKGNARLERFRFFESIG